jgi:hypothetical protein
MFPTKVHRLSGWLVFLGYCILVPCFLGFCLTVLFAIVGATATGKATADVSHQAKQDAIVKLKAIEGIPTSVISDFETNATFQEASLSALTPSQREQVQEVQTSYNAEVAGATIGTGVAATIGGGLMLVMFIITIPGQIIGFLLILRKKVWKCGQCGYVFERA